MKNSGSQHKYWYKYENNVLLYKNLFIIERLLNLYQFHSFSNTNLSNLNGHYQ